jgi:phosphoribosylglycinamide formyltransferase 1
MTSVPGNGPVVVLATDGPSTRIVYHALERELAGVRVVLEQPVSRLKLLRGRLKKLSALEVAGQLLFVSVANPILRREAGGRIEEIKREYGLNDSPITGPVYQVDSVNSPATRELLRDLAPAVVVVNGTRIIGRETLRAVAVPFINTHAGITPLYRGVHGGYWALAEGRAELAGTTIHFVDEGIDTGSIIGQATFTASSNDNFATYPYLQTAVGLPILVEAVRTVVGGGTPARKSRDDLPSRLRYHPTLWGYLGARIRRGVR